MKIVPATKQLGKQFAQEIAELVHQTGPVPYDYQFGDKEFLTRVVKGSLPEEYTLFGFDGLYLGVEGAELVGILYAFPGPEFEERKLGLAKVLQDMVGSKEVTIEEVIGLADRGMHAQWLNPALHPGTYYIHAIAVKSEHRGKQSGVKLIQQATELGRSAECKNLQLDVMSDNPAVNFYQSQGLEILAETTAPKPRHYGVPPEYRMGMKLS